MAVATRERDPAPSQGKKNGIMRCWSPTKLQEVFSWTLRTMTKKNRTTIFTYLYSLGKESGPTDQTVCILAQQTNGMIENQICREPSWFAAMVNRKKPNR